MLVAGRVASLLLLLALGGASGCSRSKAMPAVKPSSGHSASSSAEVRHERPRDGELHVLVVDESGAPLSGVSVSGDYPRNSTPMGSTCCSAESLGEQTTGRDGVAVLEAPPRTFRPSHVTASRPGWPPQTLTFIRSSAVETDAWGRVVIVLGPARDVRGRIDMGPDCPPGFVEVTGALPQVSALVAGDGQFVLRGLSASGAVVGFSACGRNAGARVARGASAPVALVLPPRTPGPWPFDVPPSATPPITSPSSAAPSARSDCLQPGGELVGAGDFDTLALDEQCRFVLAGKSILVGRHNASNWTLLRPDGTTLPIGASLRGLPAIGDNLVYLSVPSDEPTVEIVDFVRGKREVVMPPANFLPAAHDTAVLVRPALTQAGSQAQSLEIRWYDGTRRKLQGPVSALSLVRNQRSLVYDVVPGKRSLVDVHLLDLETRVDRVVAKGVLRSRDIEDGRALEIQEKDRVIVYDIERGTRAVLRSSAAWQVFGRDLALETEADGSASLRKPKATIALPFRWPRGARAHRLGDRYLFFGADGHAVVVDLANGAPRALASGVQVFDHTQPPLSGDRVALSEASGRVLVASLAGEPLRAVGRGSPRAFSPDGRWLMIVHDHEHEVTLAPISGGEPVTLPGWPGNFAPDAPALFVHLGGSVDDSAYPLYVTNPALGRTIELEPRVLSYHVLRGGEVLVIVPPGGKRAPGIYRLAVPR